ncbi:vacuolar protein-sorting-associated protein 36-like [Dysidea avara]|uniref:vacuolar protein-sorting-associated protein 36-like n=1 Tax=Dysidea avara TaxID=196820 RepID=UPI00332EBFAD
MDRFYWAVANEHYLGETVLAQQAGVRLYNGEDRTMYESGMVELTTHRIIWDDEGQEGNTIAVDLSLVVRTEESAAQFRRSAKIVLYLNHPKGPKSDGPVFHKKYDLMKLSFRKGGKDEFHSQLKDALGKKSWEKVRPPPVASNQGKSLRMGIMSIERNIEKSQQETTKSVSEAFKDLDALIDKAKDMISLVNQFAADIEEKKGTITEDETIAFKSTLLSVGIANPVTKETHGTGTSYHQELAKQLASFLERPLASSGGMMTLADVYCHYNRARGMELCSPDDIITACNTFELLKLPLRLHKFDSGVLVVQSVSHSKEAIVEETSKLVTEKGSMIVQDLCHTVNVSAVLAKERLLLTEQAGRICRDESIQGLRFFPNKFLQFQ